MKLKNFTPTAARRLMLTLFVALLTMTAQAADFNVTANGITWSCTIESGTNVSIKPADKSSLPASVTIPTSVTYSETTYTVTSIGNFAFKETSLTSATIPASVMTIGESAFEKAGLTSVTFEAGSLLTTIGSYAFGDAGLTSITIPASVKTIGHGSFRGNFLTSVTFEAGSQLTTIGQGAFYYCTSLTSITIPASVTTIGEGAFQYCTSLTSTTIPASVTTIEGGAFYKCSKLASVIVYRLPAAPAPALGSQTFDDNAAVRKIYVTPTSYSSFSTVWSAYASDLVYIPDAFIGTNISANQDPQNTSNYWCTYYNPTYSMQVPSGVTIYKAKVSDDHTKVILTEVAGNTITVGQAVVLKKIGSASITLSQKLEAAGDYSGNELKGGSTVTDGYQAYTLTAMNYGSGQKTMGFYWFSPSGTLDANKAHLELANSSARGFIGFDEDDGATAIEAPEIVSDSDDGDIYDLMGRKVEGQPTKGIYVKQGRKFIVK